jgi:hypothetical protein
MSKPMFDFRRYGRLVRLIITFYTALTILVGVAAALIFAFLARPVPGSMLLAGFLVGGVTAGFLNSSPFRRTSEMLRQMWSATHISYPPG